MNFLEKGRNKRYLDTTYKGKYCAGAVVYIWKSKKYRRWLIASYTETKGRGFNIGYIGENSNFEDMIGKVEKAIILYRYYTVNMMWTNHAVRARIVTGEHAGKEISLVQV